MGNQIAVLARSETTKKSALKTGLLGRARHRAALRADRDDDNWNFRLKIELP
jgi:hypothetical protein